MDNHEKIIENNFLSIYKTLDEEFKTNLMENSTDLYIPDNVTGNVDDELSWITAFARDEYFRENVMHHRTDNVSNMILNESTSSNKNGKNRKKLYLAFIDWAKEFNAKNTFGSIFDKDTFTVTYPFIPNDMRYFYRISNPILCVVENDLTFFQISELGKLNKQNKDIDKYLIFAASPEEVIIFNKEDSKIYKGIEENNDIILKDSIADNFDLYIQNLINKGNILES